MRVCLSVCKCVKLGRFQSGLLLRCVRLSKPKGGSAGERGEVISAQSQFVDKIAADGDGVIVFGRKEPIYGTTRRNITNVT